MVRDFLFPSSYNYLRNQVNLDCENSLISRSPSPEQQLALLPPIPSQFDNYNMVYTYNSNDVDNQKRATTFNYTPLPSDACPPYSEVDPRSMTQVNDTGIDESQYTPSVSASTSFSATASSFTTLTTNDSSEISAGVSPLSHSHSICSSSSSLDADSESSSFTAANALTSAKALTPPSLSCHSTDKSVEGFPPKSYQLQQNEEDDQPMSSSGLLTLHRCSQTSSPLQFWLVDKYTPDHETTEACFALLVALCSRSIPNSVYLLELLTNLFG